MTADRWLKLGEVIAAWQSAGLPGGKDTVRRMIDDGRFGVVHRTRGKFRTVRQSAVQAAISEELAGQADSQPETPEQADS